MNHLLSTAYCFVLFLLTVSMVNDRHSSTDSLGRDNETPKITTKIVEFDLSETDQLESLDNIVQTQQGIRVTDPARDAILTSKAISVPLDTLKPFLALGSRWTLPAAADNDDGIHLEIRFASVADQWSQWKRVARDEHLTVAQDTLVGELQFLPKSTKYIQFRFVLTSSSQTGGVAPNSVLFSFTSPDATSPQKLGAFEARKRDRKLRDKTGSPNQQYPMPDYVSRTEWDCPDGQEPSGPVVATDVTHQIVHHSAGPNSSDDWPAVVRAIWDYHVNTNNWSDIGYNWLVDPNGIIYQGRGWIDGNDEVQGAHFCGTNSNTMGACLLGNFEEAEPASEALASLEDLLAWKSDQKGIDPLGQEYHASSGLTLFNISGHRDGCSTLCPGENLYLRLPAIRNNVQSLIGQPAVSENIITSLGNYPNPFSRETTISFTLEEAANVRITIWDLNGRRLEEVANGFYAAESHQESWNASNYASGIYFCRIEVDNENAVQKMVLVQ